MFIARDSRTMANPKTRAAMAAMKERAAEAVRQREMTPVERARIAREREPERALEEMRARMVADRERLESELAEAVARIDRLEGDLGQRIDLDEWLARNTLPDWLSPEAVLRLQMMRRRRDPAWRYRPTMRRILERICRGTGISAADILSDRRVREIVFARQAFFYWSIRLGLKSYPEIGRFCGGRDHTTVLHGVRVYPEKRAAMGRFLRPVSGVRCDERSERKRRAWQ